MNKSFKKMILIFIVVVAVTTVLVVTTVKNAVNTIDNQYSNFTSKVGGKMILGTDTLQIIDCSVLNNTYTLSNGVEIHYQLVDSTHYVPKEDE